jgi:hypothetical protein
LTPPYFSNNKTRVFDRSSLSFLLKRTPLQIENIKQTEVNRLIQLYTPAGFLKEYEKTGRFQLPYEIDSPVTPSLEIISHPEYYYYQKLILDLHNEKETTFANDKKSVLRELYRFLSYK